VFGKELKQHHVNTVSLLVLPHQLLQGPLASMSKFGVHNAEKLLSKFEGLQQHTASTFAVHQTLGK
jgi:hypothetical protein